MDESESIKNILPNAEVVRRGEEYIAIIHGLELNLGKHPIGEALRMADLLKELRYPTDQS